MSVLSKIIKFLLILSMIAAVVLTLGAVYTIYIVDQTSKIQHYNDALRDCVSTPGATVRYEASTPVFGSGIKMTCEHAIPYENKL